MTDDLSTNELLAQSFPGTWHASRNKCGNHNTLDNRRGNLRAVPKVINCVNRSGPNRNSTSGVLGISKHHSKWRAASYIGGKMKVLGRYNTAEEAGRVAAEYRNQQIAEGQLCEK